MGMDVIQRYGPRGGNKGTTMQYSSGGGLITKGVLLIIVWLILTNVALFSGQTMLLLGIGAAIWFFMRRR